MSTERRKEVGRTFAGASRKSAGVAGALETPPGGSPGLTRRSSAVEMSKGDKGRRNLSRFSLKLQQLESSSPELAWAAPGVEKRRGSCSRRRPPSSWWFVSSLAGRTEVGFVCSCRNAGEREGRELGCRRASPGVGAVVGSASRRRGRESCLRC